MCHADLWSHPVSNPYNHTPYPTMVTLRPRSCSWMVDSHPFRSMSVVPPSVWLGCLKLWPWKSPPPQKKQGYSQSERSHSQSSIQLICFLPILHQSDVMEWHMANNIYASVNLSIAGSANYFQLFCTKIIPRQMMTLWPNYVETKLNDTKLKIKDVSRSSSHSHKTATGSTCARNYKEIDIWLVRQGCKTTFFQLENCRIY